MTTVNVQLESLEAVLETLGLFEFALERDPNLPIREVGLCGCVGPLPECKCRRRARLVSEVKALVSEARA